MENIRELAVNDLDRFPDAACRLTAYAPLRVGEAACRSVIHAGLCAQTPFLCDAES
jgi:hypothetical protein